MGCDIQLHTEVKINGQWHHYGAPSVDRNYTLFALLANVRNDEPGDKWYVTPISEPRGLPADATALTKFDSDRWGLDGHSHSWINAEEIARVAEFANSKKWRGRDGSAFWEADNFGYLFGNNWSGFTKYPEGRPEGLEDVRFVFWFDN
jgi:hypothetical protein